MLDMFGHLIFPTKHGGLAPLHDLYTNQKFHPSVASLVAAHSPEKSGSAVLFILNILRNFLFMGFYLLLFFTATVQVTLFIFARLERSRSSTSHA